MKFCIDIPIGSIIRYVGSDQEYIVIGCMIHTDDIIIINKPEEYYKSVWKK